MADNVNHPSHYESGKFECIDVMREALGDEVVKGFCLGNAFKYIYRCMHKHSDPTEDVKKAKWYLNKWCEIKTPAEEQETENKEQEEETPNKKIGEYCHCDEIYLDFCWNCRYCDEDEGDAKTHCGRCRHSQVKGSETDHECWFKQKPSAEKFEKCLPHGTCAACEFRDFDANNQEMPCHGCRHALGRDGNVNYECHFIERAEYR